MTGFLGGGIAGGKVVTERSGYIRTEVQQISPSHVQCEIEYVKLQLRYAAKRIGCENIDMAISWTGFLQLASRLPVDLSRGPRTGRSNEPRQDRMDLDSRHHVPDGTRQTIDFQPVASINHSARPAILDAQTT